MAEYVIIGNGVAAVGCIEGIRSVDKDTKITVVSAENHPVYGRPLISYYLEGKTTLEKMNYRPDDFYEVNGCEVVYGKKAVKLDIDGHSVQLDDGSVLPYSAVCVATGSDPFVPPFTGLDTVKEKYTFMTMDDMLALEQAVTPESKVLIVGAGLIGLKCAEGLHGRVKEIVVCDLADRVLSSILDDTCAKMMQDCLEDAGIQFALGDSVAKFEGSKATLQSGKVVDFDVLVVAVGVRANTALVKDGGGAVNRGILVDEKMQTSLADVYAAGDCTEGEDITIGAKRVLAILPNAYLQGRCAGINMAGGDEVFDKGMPMNSIGFFGLHAMTAGSYFGPEQGGELYEEKEEGRLKRLYTKDGYLTGFILIGGNERAGIYTSLIREKVPLDTINFELLKKGATLAAFSPETRRKSLGGVV